MRFNLPRFFVPALLVATLLIAPLPASAAPGARTFGSLWESSWGAFLDWSGDLVRHLWAEEGISIDPLGVPSEATPQGNGRHVWAEEGISIDPLGRTAPAPAATPEGGW